MTVDLVAGVPFELTRQVMASVVPRQPSSELRVGLRPFFHYPRLAEESPTARIKGELRLPTAQRAQLNFGFAARHLADHGIESLEVTVRGRLGDADLAFLQAIAPVVAVTVRLVPTLLGAAPASTWSTAPPTTPVSAREDQTDAHVDPAGDTVQPVGDAESRAVLAARDAIVASPPGERGELWCRTLSRYLSSGDPWTARWVSEQVLGLGVAATPEVCAAISTAYLYSDHAGAVHAARDFARAALGGEGRINALGLYQLAISELRYLPRGARHPGAVPALLDEASELLAAQPFEDVASEFVLVANARALHQLGAGNGERACRVLEHAIETVSAHGYADTTAHAIMLNNLGRALDRTFEADGFDAARAALQRSVEIESSNPDGWLDLAQFFARHEMFDAAVSAARRGLAAVEVFPELWDLLGFCLDALGRHEDAADAFAAGIRVGGDRVLLGLAGARQLLHAGNTARAREALRGLAELTDRPGADRDAMAEVAVLGIAVERPQDPAEAVARFEALAARFPESDLVHANLAAARDWHRSSADSIGQAERR